MVNKAWTCTVYQRRRYSTFPCRTKTKDLSANSSFCFNAFLMLPPTTAIFLLLLLVTLAQAGGAGSWGARGGVLGVCRLTWAQAAICHPTLASLILILSPAWPSRPAVSSPQKGFLLGGVVVVLVGRQRQGGAVGAGELHIEALWPGPWPGGAHGPDRQHHVYSLPPPPPPLSFISHTDPRGWRRDRRGGGERDREGEGGGQMNTMKRLTRTTLTPLLHPPFIFGCGSLYSLWAGCCPLLLSPVWPLSSLLHPSAATARRAPTLCVANHAPTGHLNITVF